MAFTPLIDARKSPRPRTDDITVAAYEDGHGRFVRTTFNIPRSLLSQASLDDVAGGQFDILIGSGDDAGCIAIVPGYRVRTNSIPRCPHRVELRTTVLADGRMAATKCEYRADPGRLIITMPRGFPWRPGLVAEKPALAAVA